MIKRVMACCEGMTKRTVDNIVTRTLCCFIAGSPSPTVAQQKKIYIKIMVTFLFKVESYPNFSNVNEKQLK